MQCGYVALDGHNGTGRNAVSWHMHELYSGSSKWLLSRLDLPWNVIYARVRREHLYWIWLKRLFARLTGDTTYTRRTPTFSVMINAATVQCIFKYSYLQFRQPMVVELLFQCANMFQLLHSIVFYTSSEIRWTIVLVYCWISNVIVSRLYLCHKLR